MKRPVEALVGAALALAAACAGEPRKGAAPPIPGAPASSLPPRDVSARAATPDVLGISCLPLTAKPDARLCAVVTPEMHEGEAPDGPARHDVHGSTVTVSRWFSPPEATAPRVFTLIARGASRVVVGQERVLLGARSTAHGAPEPPRAGRAAVGYVVDPAPGEEYAIDGAHEGARYFEGTSFGGDAARLAEGVRAEDRAWRDAEPAGRQLARTEIRDEQPGRSSVSAAVTARLARAAADRWSCVSFAYVVGDELRGTFPCAESGPPRGILQADGAASWVFVKDWGR